LYRAVKNFAWLQLGADSLRLGWVLDPLGALLLVMVSFVGLMIFIYSVGYMAQDENFTRFFCFLSLFAAAMLGVVIANSLLLLFICWELVGFTSYMLIGFWYHKPSAAAAAKKAFITTRVGDIGLFIGMIWLYAQTGTLLFYDGGNGCLEQSALTQLVAQTTLGGLAVSTAVSLLIFCGAVGKSGQVPLHVWLPDAMEGPTPVSALIHAATMVAAGVFLVARVYPLLDPASAGVAGPNAALTVVAWVGAITAVFAALIAVAQTDIKRILAYSTVSQLGYMMLGLGVGGYVAGMFHLITHAFFKALLFLGAGSVIHGCHEEQDIRRLGGLRRLMPVTFATYAVGMMALCGVPVFFSGFWSKEDILHEALKWEASRWPFYLGLLGAVLTAFYMTRQVCYVFFGRSRFAALPVQTGHHGPHGGHSPPDPAVSVEPTAGHSREAGHSLSVHESPPVMTLPLVVLAVGAVLVGFLGTPAWPWFHDYLTGHPTAVDFGRLFQSETLGLMLLSSLLVAVGIGAGWWLYGRRPPSRADEADALERMAPTVYATLRQKFLVDELYEVSVVRFQAWWAGRCDWLDRFVWGGVVAALSYLALGLSWLNRLIDEYGVNLGFDKSCEGLRGGGGRLSKLQSGQVHHYLRSLGVALTVLVLLLMWGCAK
jgi:NADH-quinone oxidoreductase subunit L